MQTILNLQQLASLLGRVCKEVGFFYVINHPSIQLDLVQKMFEHSEKLFALPSEVTIPIFLLLQEKHNVDWKTDNRGYVGLLRERLNPNRPGFPYFVKLNIEKGF
jgi:isopenicillin N synthase-like dioxygenase